MTYTEEKFVEILHNYINRNSKVELQQEKIDEERMKELFAIHRLYGIGYSYLKQYKFQSNIVSELETGFFSEVTKYQRRKYVLDTFLELLTKHEIIHVCFKGSYLGEIYPVKELRTMSDVDILIKKEDREKVREILLSNGATANDKESDATVDVYLFYGINLEIHNNLVSGGAWMNGVDFNGYYSNVINKCTQIEGCTYKIADSDHLIYLVYHAAKHFYESGIGVRMLMDFPVLVRYSDELDWSYIWDELEKIKLSNFAVKIFEISEKFFGEFGIEYRKKEDFAQIEQMSQFIIDGGVYGLHNRSNDARRLRNMSATKDGNQNMIVGTFKMLFPSNEQMRRYSEWYKDKPSILLPVAYVERIVRNIKERGGFMKVAKEAPSVYIATSDKDDVLKIMNLQ
ncbi:MAG: hypothetical protein E7254_06770 [Lachnospiraceae bacterium]|nr:hypothetical protein [Lachnospiraceae bacterium]